MKKFALLFLIIISFFTISICKSLGNEIVVEDLKISAEDLVNKKYGITSCTINGVEKDIKIIDPCGYSNLAIYTLDGKYKIENFILSPLCESSEIDVFNSTNNGTWEINGNELILNKNTVLMKTYKFVKTQTTKWQYTLTLKDADNKLYVYTYSVKEK